MIDPALESLLAEARTAHANTPELAKFCAFPQDLTDTPVSPYSIPAARLMEHDNILQGAEISRFAKASIAAGPVVHWRETYKDTDIGQEFLGRFGCYCLIGPNGAYHSKQMLAFVVYMPPGLYYPWHHHPAEEMYLVLAGEAEFRREGEAPQTLGVGQTSFHASDQPHAMETHDQPILAYVIWRNNFGIKPVLTDRKVPSA